jgi:peptidoglycan/xylan/chitin deacetylase (PgdA/CDA1 family)
MVEAAILIAVWGIVLLAGLGLWRVGCGPAGGWWRRLGRAFALGLPLAVLGAVVTWRLMDTPRYQVLGRIVARVETDQPVVALTFDDGPTVEFTGEILEVLAAEGVPATFFAVGEALEKRPEACQALVAAGHELGNHSYSHRPLILASYGTIRAEIERTDALIRACGYDGPIAFRPPNGKKLLLLPAYLAANGRTTVTWDVGPEGDREVAADRERIAAYVLERVQPGSIVLLHAMYRSRAESRAALPAIIQGLKARGYRLVTLSTLLSSP